MKKGNIAVLIALNAAMLVFLNIVVFLNALLPVFLFSVAVSLLFMAFMLLAVDKAYKTSATRCRMEYVEADSSTMQILLGLSVPCVLCDDAGSILWYNAAVSDIVPEKSLDGSNLALVFPGVDFKDSGEAKINHRSYSFSTSRCGREKNLRLITFSDVTEIRSLTEKCSSVRSILCYILVDNYAEVMSGISGNESGKLAIEIEEKLLELAEYASGIIHRLERDRYVLVLDMEHLVVLMADRFGILSSVKEIRNSNDIPVTVSIGACFADESVGKSASGAKAALEIALGRGGDQAVVKLGDEFKFFGGSSVETEKKTKVRARVMAQALCEIIGNAYQVIIMGHENGDADSFGAAIGIYSIANSLGVRARIICDKSNLAVFRATEKFKELKEYEFAFITAEQAFNIINEKTVVVLLDTHKADRAEAPEILKLTTRLVVIDHHRRSTDCVNNTILTYHEPYASSTCEMVTEILQYTDCASSLKRQEAEALFAGIMLDTKNFTVKTGVRTFDAASFLRKRGADTAVVRELFKTDLASYKKRMEIINSSEMFRTITIISKAEGADIETCALAADEMLNISGVQASFVVSNQGEYVNISARSTGNVNVQLITEKLGGGGHMTVAGAQLGTDDTELAKEQLKEAINSYFAESY